MATSTLDKVSLKKPYNSERSGAIITNLGQLKHLKALILLRLMLMALISFLLNDQKTSEITA